MDDNSLKDSTGKARSFDTNDRFKYLEAVEQATQEMIRQLRGYVALHEVGPEVIAVRNVWYQPSPCIQELTIEVKRLGLTSKVVCSNNGTLGDLNFDLDGLADQYLSTRPEIVLDSLSII